MHAVFGNPPVLIEGDFLILYPGGFNIPQGFGRTRNTHLDGFIEAFDGGSLDFRDACYRHGISPFSQLVGTGLGAMRKSGFVIVIIHSMVNPQF